MYTSDLHFHYKGLKELLMAPAKFPGCSGSRNLHDNISDLRAQVAANQKVCLLKTIFNFSIILLCNIFRVSHLSLS